MTTCRRHHTSDAIVVVANLLQIGQRVAHLCRVLVQHGYLVVHGIDKSRKQSHACSAAPREDPRIDRSTMARYVQHVKRAVRHRMATTYDDVSAAMPSALELPSLPSSSLQRGSAMWSKGGGNEEAAPLTDSFVRFRTG
jgi:hypothetical protein